MSNTYVIIGSPSKQLYDKCINGNTLNGNLDSNLDYSAYWNRPEYEDVHRTSRVSSSIDHTPSFDYGEVINGEHLENNNTDINYITISKTPLGQVHFTKTTKVHNDTVVFPIATVGGNSANNGIYSSQSFNKDKYYTLTSIFETSSDYSHSLNMRQSISYRPLFKVA